MYARRTILKGAAALPLAAILADPILSAAMAAETADVTIATPSGRNVTAALALPDATPAGTVLLIHEWWGLNDQIRSVAADYARAGYVALAVDLYNGEVAADPPDAQRLSRGMDGGEATETLVAWIDWLRASNDGNGKVATIGWCFGGGWSLNASLAAPVDATVIYYGNVRKSADELAALSGPVLGHFGTLDRFINKEMVDGFVAEMDKTGKPYAVHWYTANHAFANPSGRAFDSEDSELAWSRTAEFLKEHLS
jgi:carboxymethylenebutenolidase